MAMTLLDPDKLWLFGRIGDIRIDEKGQVGRVDGEPDMIDPQEWDNPEIWMQEVIQKRHFVSTVDRSLKDEIRALIQKSKDAAGNDIHTKSVIDYSRFTSLKDVDGNTVASPSTEIYTPNKKPIFDLTGKSLNDIFVDATKKDFKKIAPITDWHQTSSGSVTIGSTGTFLTWGGGSGFCADIISLTGALTGTEITATTETGEAFVTGKNLSSYNLTYDSLVPHKGDPTAGLLTSWNLSGALQGWAFNTIIMTTGKVIIKNLYGKAVGTTGAMHNMIYMYAPSQLGTYEYSDLLFDGNGANCYRGIYTSNLGNSTVRCKNINGWDMIYTPFDFFSFGVGATGILENCNAYNSAIGFDVFNRIMTYNNCTGSDNGTDFNNIGNSTGNNNSSSDTTAGNGNWSAGANNIINQTTANCVVSTNDTNADFFKLTEDGPWDGAGVTNTITRPFGIRGNAVPGPNGTSMGVAERETIPTGIVAIDNTVPEVAADGFFGFQGTAAIDNTVPEVAAAGAVGFTGTATIESTVPTVEAFGGIPVTGTVAIVNTVPTVSALGTYAVVEIVSGDSLLKIESTLTSTI